MKKTKRILAFVLSLSMLTFAGLQSVSADEAVVRYQEVDGTETLIGDAEVHVYSTAEAGTIRLTGINSVQSTFPQGSGYREYTAEANEGWIWKGWKFNQMFNGKDLGNRTDFGWGKRYSFTNSSDDWSEPYNGTGATISVNRLLTAGETTFSKIVYNLYADFNPTVTATAGQGGSITDAGVTEVEYGTEKEYTVTAEEGKVIESVTLDGVDLSIELVDGPGLATFTFAIQSVITPHQIQATFMDEVHTVSYAFLSTTQGKELPSEVTDLLPVSTTAVHGSEVTAVQPSSTIVEMTDGYWEFEGYDLPSCTVAEDVVFTGSWKYVLRPQQINSAPVIHAEDRTLEVGSSFDPMKDVTAEDAEDGDLTAHIEILSNDVDTAKAGTYRVSYQVADSQNSVAVKSIQVTVKEKAIVTPDPAPQEPEHPEPSPLDRVPDTADSSSMGMWMMICLLTASVLAVSIKKQMNH